VCPENIKSPHVLGGKLPHTTVTNASLNDGWAFSRSAAVARQKWALLGLGMLVKPTVVDRVKKIRESRIKNRVMRSLRASCGVNKGVCG